MSCACLLRRVRAPDSVVGSRDVKKDPRSSAHPFTRPSYRARTFARRSKDRSTTRSCTRFWRGRPRYTHDQTIAVSARGCAKPCGRPAMRSNARSPHCAPIGAVMVGGVSFTSHPDDLMATREASQKHAVVLELQQVLVAVKAAEYLSNPQAPVRQPIEPGASAPGAGRFVWCHKQPRDVLTMVSAPLPCITPPLAM